MITITGATGKTGSGVADILLEKSERVRVVGRSAERLERFRLKGAEIAGCHYRHQLLRQWFDEANELKCQYQPPI